MARALVERKDEILNLQRKLADPTLQGLCDKSAAKITGKQNDRTQREYQLFSRFCQAANIPLYPVMPVLIKLCHFAKNGGKAPPTSSLTRALEKLIGVGENVFRDKPEYNKLCQLGDELVGMKEDGSSIATSDTTDDEEALSTDAQTDDEADSSEGIFSLSDSCSGDQASLATSGVTNSPQQQRVAKILGKVRLPHDGQVFDSYGDAEVACALATLKSHGVSVYGNAAVQTYGTIFCTRRRQRGGKHDPCNFAVRFDRQTDGSWVLNGAESSFKHNHKPDPRRLADPAWLPEINKKSIRRALGLEIVVPSSSTKRSAKRALPVDVDSDESFASTSETSAAPALSRKRHSSGRAVKRQAMAPPPNLLGQQPAVATGSTNTSFLPPLRRPVFDSNPISVETIRAFLASAYPDLVPRADAFFEAGITTFDQLVAFHCLSDPIKAAFLNSV